MELSALIKAAGGSCTINCPVIADLAIRAGCSHRTLYMIVLGHKQAGHKLARALEAATNGKVTRGELRPDVFGPEPIKAEAA